MNDFEILEGHEGRRTRLRRRIMEDGLDELAPHEIVEFMLYQAIPRQDVNDLAHALLNRFETIMGIANAGYDALMTVEGLGESGARLFCALKKYFDVCMESVNDPDAMITIANYADAFSFAALIRKYYQPPRAVQLCLDTEGHLMYHSSFCADPRWGGAAQFSLALNDAICGGTRDILILLYTGQHTPVPSAYDIDRTRSYSRLLHTAKCALLDVILVGRKRITSMRRMDLIPDFNFSDKHKSLRERYMRGMPTQDSLPIEDFPGNFPGLL